MQIDDEAALIILCLCQSRNRIIEIPLWDLHNFEIAFSETPA